MIDYNVSKNEFEFIKSHYEFKDGKLISKSTGKPVKIISDRPDGQRARISVGPSVRRRVYIDAIKSLLHYGTDVSIDENIVTAVLDKFSSIESASKARTDSRIAIRMSINGNRIRVPYHIIIAVLKAAEVPVLESGTEASKENKIFHKEEPQRKPESEPKSEPKKEGYKSPQEKVLERIHKRETFLESHTVKSDLSLQMKAIYHGPVADIDIFNKMFDEVTEVVRETIEINNGDLDSIIPEHLAKHLINDIRPELEALLASWVRIVIVGMRKKKI